MPTQTVIEKLKDLQKELELVATAVKHIDDASKVAKSASEILLQLPKLITDLKSIEEKHRQELLKIHKDKIDTLENQLQSLLVEFKDKSKQIGQLINETQKLQKTISDYYSKINQINFPERLDKIDNQISSINIGIANLQSAIQNTQSKVDKVNSSVKELNKHIDEKISGLENVICEEIKTNRVITIILGGVLLIGVIIILALSV